MPVIAPSFVKPVLIHISTGMPAAVDVEDLLARQRELDRPPGELGELARGDLVGERIELAAEAAADRRRDHADVRRGHVEDLGEQAVHVVRRLGRGPERELAVRAPLGQRRVLLHRQVGVALEVEDVLAHEIGGRERRVHVAELQRHRLVHVRPVAVLVDAHLGMLQRILDGHQGRGGARTPPRSARWRAPPSPRPPRPPRRPRRRPCAPSPRRALPRPATPAGCRTSRAAGRAR